MDDLDALGFKKLEKLRFQKVVQSLSEYLSVVSTLGNEEQDADGQSVFDDMEREVGEQRSRSEVSATTSNEASMSSEQVSRTIDRAADAVAIADKRSSQLTEDVQTLNAEILAIKNLTKFAITAPDAAAAVLPRDEVLASPVNSLDSNSGPDHSLDEATARMAAQLQSAVDSAVNDSADESILKQTALQACDQIAADQILLAEMEASLEAKEKALREASFGHGTSDLAGMQAELASTQSDLAEARAEIDRWVAVSERMHSQLAPPGERSKAPSSTFVGEIDEWMNMANNLKAPSGAFVGEIDEWMNMAKKLKASLGSKTGTIGPAFAPAEAEAASAARIAELEATVAEQQTAIAESAAAKVKSTGLAQNSCVDPTV